MGSGKFDAKKDPRVGSYSVQQNGLPSLSMVFGLDGVKFPHSRAPPNEDHQGTPALRRSIFKWLAFH